MKHEDNACSNDLVLDNINIIYWFVNKNYNKYKNFFDSKEDMQQELIKDMYCIIDKYNPKYSYSTFAYISLTNFCRTQVRKQKVSKTDKLVLEKDLYQIINEIDMCYDKNEDGKTNEYSKLENFISSDNIEQDIEFNLIKDKCSDLLLKYYYEDITQEKLAQEKKCSKQAIGKKINNEIKKIKKDMGLLL